MWCSYVIWGSRHSGREDDDEDVDDVDDDDVDDDGVDDVDDEDDEKEGGRRRKDTLHKKSNNPN